MQRIFSGVIVYILSNEFLEFKNRIFEFLPVLLLIVAIGIEIYIGITYLTDSRIQILFKAILGEMKEKGSQYGINR